MEKFKREVEDREMSLFSQFKLNKSIIQAINDIGFEEPSAIQTACIPTILSGKDVVGQAQTGTGKTAAFGIPMVELISKKPVIQGIVLTPTRELAIQVSQELSKIAKYKGLKILPIYGGQSVGHQIRALKQGAHIVVGTPGRMLDHIRKNTIRLNNVKLLVLDEADEMLDMGFIDDIEAIIKQVPTDRQTLLFSATISHEIKKLSNRYLKNQEFITINQGDVTVPSIKQVYYKVLEANKLDGLCRILDFNDIELGMIFCRTKKAVSELTEALQTRGYLVDGIHGDLNQSQRERVMKQFREKSIEYLIATDVAARGIDVEDVTHVINYDIPQDPESYVHRIGRTGRAGKNGIAITLVTPREIKQLRTIEQKINIKITSEVLPDLEELRSIQQQNWKEQIIDLITNNKSVIMDYHALVEDLSTQFNLKDITAATLHLTFNDKFLTRNDFEDYDFGETGARPGMVRFFMNIGRNLELTPKEIENIISQEIDIPSNQVGKINIFEKFSFVEVSKDIAPFVYEGLRFSKISGRRLIFEPAKPRT